MQAIDHYELKRAKRPERKENKLRHAQAKRQEAKVLERASAKRLIVMGDFNQTIGPGSRARPQLRLALQEAFPPSMTIPTSTLAFQGRRSVDHIALSEDLAVGSLGMISNIHEGRNLSAISALSPTCLPSTSSSGLALSAGGGPQKTCGRISHRITGG